MKITLYLLDLAGGGAERSFLHLAEVLAERGHDVEILVERWRGAYCDHLPAGVQVRTLGKYRKGLARLRLAIGFPLDAWRVLRCRLVRRKPFITLRQLVPMVDYMRSRQPDVVIAALRYTPFIALWAKKLAKTDTRVIVTEHNMFSPRLIEHARDTEQHRKLRLLQDLIKRNYPRADAVVGVSDGVAEDFARQTGLSRDRVHRIYNPVVTPRLLLQADELPEHPWFRSGAPPVVLAAGRLTEVKNFAGLLDAFALLPNHLEARLVIVGEGTCREPLLERAIALGVADRLDLPGWVSNPYALMRHASVFVRSSVREGLGNVLIEAMACGVPLVSTDCPSGPREILADGRYGCLVPMNDATALARAIEAQILEGQRDTGIEQARHFSASASADQYLALTGAIPVARIPSSSRESVAASSARTAIQRDSP